MEGDDDGSSDDSDPFALLVGVGAMDGSKVFIVGTVVGDPEGLGLVISVGDCDGIYVSGVCLWFVGVADGTAVSFVEGCKEGKIVETKEGPELNLLSISSDSAPSKAPRGKSGPLVEDPSV